MKYICEICNKKFDTVAEAEKCELEHKKETEKMAARASVEAKISDAYNAFITKYKAIPTIELTEESRKILLGCLQQTFDDTFETLFDRFICGYDTGSVCSGLGYNTSK